MDLRKFKLDELLLAAIKSEIDSKEVYDKLAMKVKSSYMKQRLEFLAGEEKKHKAFLETVFRDAFPNKKIEVPKKTPVPLPSFDVDDKSPYVSEVLEKAANAEKAARDFYETLAKRFDHDLEVKDGILHLAMMEEIHQKLIELELDKIKAEEDYIIDWPMMHSGP